MQIGDLTVHNLRYEKLCTLTDNSGYSAYDVVEKNSLNEITEFTFKYPLDDNGKHLYLSNENLVRFNNEYYRIKTNNIIHDEDGKKYCDITARHLSETLQYTMVTMAEQTPKTVEELMKVALCYEDDKPTLGWSIGNITVSTTMKRGLEAVEESAFSILTTIAEKYKGILHFNSMTRTVDLLEISSVLATKFDLRVSKDLKNVDVTYDTSDMITKLYCFGATDKDGNELNIMSVNPTGKAYVENYDYFKQLGYTDEDIKNRPELFTKTSIWRDTNYYEAQDLYDEGVKQVADMSVPVVTVNIKALDLSQFGNYRTSSLAIGDVLKVIDEDIGMNFFCNVTSISKDYKEPHILDISVTNLIQYKDMISKLFSDVSTVGTVITPSGRVIGSKIDNIKADQIVDLDLKYIKTDFAKVNYLTVDQINAKLAAIDSLKANVIDVETLKANVAEINEATINKLNVHSEIVYKINGEFADFTNLTTKNFTAVNANIDTLSGNVADFKSVTTDNFTTTNANIDKINGNLASFKDLTTNNFTATNAKISSLDGDFGKFKDLTADNFKATNANVDTLTGNVGDIKTLVNGNLSSVNIQSKGITSDKLSIENGFITNAMILNLIADKIKSGKINTTLIDIGSESGSLSIKDNTIQIKDTNIPRVQIGKDASNDYSMYVWDKDGNLMFDALGIHDSAIKSGIIRNDMVSDSANIDGKKLNIESVVSGINGASTKLTSSSIVFDSTGQTLNVKFNTLEKSIDGITIGGQNLLHNSLSLVYDKYRFDGPILTDGTGLSLTDSSGVLLTEGNSSNILYADIVKNPSGYDEMCCHVVINDKYDPLRIGNVMLIDGEYIFNAYIRSTKSTYVQINGNKYNITTSWKRINTLMKRTDDNFDIYFLDNGDYYIYHAMFEFGNKASDWTPSQSDVDESISGVRTVTEQHTTDLSVINGKINTLIDNTTFAKDGITTQLKDEYSKLEQTVGSIKTTIFNQQTTIDENTQNISNAKTKQTEFEQTLDGFTDRISSVENTITTKADGSTVTTISDNLSSLTQTVNGFDAKFSTVNTEIEKKADGTTVTTIDDKVGSLTTTVDGLSSSFSKLSETVETKADGSTVTSLSNDVASMSSNLTGFKSTVSSTYETKEVVSNIGDTANQAKATADNASVFANSANSNSNSAILTANTAQSVANSVQERADGGEFDAVTIYFHSSAGTAFKNDQIATTLSVVIYHGGNTITDKTGLINEFGSGAYLEWSLRKFGDTSFTTIISTDSHFSNDGFSYTVGSEDINTQAVFNVQLIV